LILNRGVAGGEMSTVDRVDRASLHPSAGTLMGEKPVSTRLHLVELVEREVGETDHVFVRWRRIAT
jgi:hypothetical protein